VASPKSVSPGDDRPDSEVVAARYASALGDVAAIGARDTRAGLFAGPYRRLFGAQVVSSLGDWLGFLAIASIAARVSKSNQDVAVGVVLSARLLPGFFFGAFATALLDRWDRKKVMVTCDIGRALIYALVPFLHNVGGLFVASLVLELLTLMWTPAKEASVPNLVAPDKLAAANSASLAAAYGTIVPALAVFPALTLVAEALGHVHPLRFFTLSQESIAIYIDVLSFLLSAILISGLALRGRTAEQKRAIPTATLRSTLRDARDGWRFIGSTYRVRAVIIGFCTALVGGGMVVPLEVTFAAKILHKGPTGFGLLAMALGFGVAASVLALSVWQRHLRHDSVFVLAVYGGGVSLLVAASMSNLALTMLCIAALGVCTGAVYVLGFTILGESTDDALRGRIFGVFYVLVRLCLLLAFLLAPLLSGLLDGLSYHLYRNVGGHQVRHELGTSSWHVALPGARLTLWLGGLIILGAASWARSDLRRAVAQGQPKRAPAHDAATPASPPSPSQSGTLPGDPSPAG
jgi:dTMP kinase